MNILVLDCETTVQRLDDGRKDPSPFHPDNKLVSVHFRCVVGTDIGPPQKAIFYHNDKPVADTPDELIEALAWADRMVMHNAKFDALWLLESGFKLPNDLFCTMIAEYILSRGQKRELSLDRTAFRYGVTAKKSDLIEELFHKQHIGFEEIPLDTVIEYADGDVLSTAELYLEQIREYRKDDNKGLQKVLKLSFEMLDFLVEIERNGINISRDALNEVEHEFLIEKAAIEKLLNDIVESVMGATPINLNSGIDATKVIYSRVITDRDKHKSVFNIGVDARGKPLRPPKMSPAAFAKAVNTTTKKINRTDAVHCQICKGRGWIQKYKVNGDPYKTTNKCTMCASRGYILIDTGKVAGLKLNPIDPSYAAVNGFKCDKATIQLLIVQAEEKGNLEAIQFLKGLSRLNAVSTYLDSFVTGIRRWTRPDGLLHSSFNQCITATGRLSSSNPNFQNLPRSGTFPVRKAVVSRFKNGVIMEADYSGLEFRTAGDLSQDQQIIADVLNSKDIHRQTASIIQQKEETSVSDQERQEAKKDTFRPIFGGSGYGEAEHVRKYYEEFFNIYPGLGEWHKELMNSALMTGIIRTPTGREFKFDNVRRLGNGRTSDATRIVNYPVQSFATADIVPLACIRVLRAMRKFKLRSKPILTVHDSLAIDTHPEEIEQVAQCLSWGMRGVVSEIKQRFGYTMTLPLDIEIKMGNSWLAGTKLEVPNWQM